MIESLKISNYALIERSELLPGKGFSVITGETGAGKSILLGALGLVLGERAESSVVREGEKKCTVELEFNMEGYGLEDWFAQNDLDYDVHTVIRREVSAEGKSRSFVNDTPVNAKVLKELGARIIDVHSQHRSLMIANPSFRTELLDSFCGHAGMVREYAVLYKRRNALLAVLEKEAAAAGETERERDYLSFRFNKLDAAALREGEAAELEREQEIMENAGTIKSVFAGLTYALRDAENNTVSQLDSLAVSAGKVGALVDAAVGFSERIKSAAVDLADLADEAERMADSVEFSEGRAEWIRERLGLLYDLQMQFKTGSVDELVAVREELREKLRSIDEGFGDTERLKAELGETEGRMESLASQLHAGRVKGASGLCGEIEGLLAGLGIKHPVFRISITPSDDFNAAGKDEVRMLFAANKNQEPDEISNIASGGEISRIMLAFKYVLSRAVKLPVIVFDEIDSGLSGEVAHRMAEMMKRMSGGMQVIAVSHLPQIAAAGDTHFKVFKEDGEDNTVSRIKLLSRDERIGEIAVMISGSEVTPEALKAAEKLLD